nr:hypothetical protein GCM10020093_019530 [Planobispora longispora]
MTAWTLAYEGFDPAGEGLSEALCTLGNGYFATRGRRPRPRPTACTTRAPTWPAASTASTPPWPDAPWATRTS